MADSDVEISVDDVCTSVTPADGQEGGVEVETIIEGHAPSTDLDFIVQEEVETTTEGVVMNPADLDPVDNVIIALQNTEQEEVAVGNFEELEVEREDDGRDSDDAARIDIVATTSKKRRSSSRAASSPKKKSRKSRKGVRFANRRIPLALATSQSVKEAKEANEASFDPQKRPRRWSRVSVPVRTLDGGEYTVKLWTTGTCGWITWCMLA